MHDGPSDQTDHSPREPMVGEGGQGVVVYAIVAVTFVVVLVLVLTSLGDSIGQGLDGLLETISQPFGT